MMFTKPTHFRTAALLLGALAVSASTASAQLWDSLTNPTYEVPVKHPPQIVIKDLQRIAIREFTGEYGAELTDRFFVELSQDGGVEVIDRGNLASVLAEQGFQNEGAVSPDSAVNIGRLLGAGAMFTGRVTRGSVENSSVLTAGTETVYEGKYKREATVYVRKTTARLTASVQLVDLTNGRTYAAKLIDANCVLENRALDGSPEAPSREDALTGAYKDAIEKMKRMILPWTETVSLIVYDDNRIGIQKSAREIARGDFEAAIETLNAGIASVTKKDEKYLCKAYYNLGIAQMYSGNPHEAVPNLERSESLRHTEIANKAIGTAKEMIRLAKEQDRLEAQAVQFAATSEAAAPKPVLFGNNDVIAMVEAGLSDDIILAKIRTTKCSFDTSTTGFIALKKAKVSDAVILAITSAN